MEPEHADSSPDGAERLAALARFGLRGVLFTAPVVVALFVLWAFAPPEPDSLLTAHVDKMERLRETPSPRVVVVGGSNVAYGIDSGRLEAALARPVVNLGVAGGLGLRFLLDEVGPWLGPGDLVVLSPEYAQFDRDYFGGRALGRLVVGSCSRCALRLSAPRQWWGILRSANAELYVAFQQRILRRVADWTGLPLAQPSTRNPRRYERAGFDARGDYVGHLDGKPSFEEGLDFWLTSWCDFEELRFYEAGARGINAFHRAAREAGAQVVMSFPPLPEPVFRRLESPIAVLHERLRRDLRLELLDEPAAQVYPASAFFDHPHHLAAAARTARTESILRALRRSHHAAATPRGEES